MEYTNLPLDDGSLIIISQDDTSTLVIHEDSSNSIPSSEIITTEFILVEKETVNIVTVLEQGIQGKDGEAGRTDLNIIFEEECFTIANTPIYSYNLLHTPLEKSLMVFLNGIKEKSQSVTVSANIVLINDLELGKGDEITFHYLYGE